MRMTAGLHAWVVGALAAFVAMCGQSQDLKSLKGIYEKSTEEILGVFQTKFDGLQQQYQNSLETLKASAVKQGDFVRTKAAIAEISRFQKAKRLAPAPDENEIPEIKALQSSYIKQYYRLEADMTAQLGMLTSKYEQALDRFQKELVKAMKLDEAAAVQAEKEKAQTSVKSYADTRATLNEPVATKTTDVADSSNPAIMVKEPAEKPALYMVIDLSDGPDAEKYPVSYLANVPKDGWGDEYKSDKLVMRRIEPGKFKMGSPEDELGRDAKESQHMVTLTKAFNIGVFEVTQKQWERVMGDWPSYFNDIRCRDARSVEQVSYNDIRGSGDGAKWPITNSVDAASFMGRLRKRTGQTFDLPTEAQWEYACRAGSETALNSGKNLTSAESCPNMAQQGRYKANSGSGAKDGGTETGTAKVGCYVPNAWGLYDMHGNVWEWCLDWTGNYSGTAIDPAGAVSGSSRTARGGSWYRYAGNGRSATRGSGSSNYRNGSFGFRACVTLP